MKVVATPMYGDQHLNSAALIHRGMGYLLPYEKINKDTVHEAVRKALQARFDFSSFQKSLKTVT